MENLVLYIHGKGGNSLEAEHYKNLFSYYDVKGLDYKSNTPWDFIEEVNHIINKIVEQYGNIIIVANSIGAYFAMNALSKMKIKKAFFISPIVDMEKVILNMMTLANVSEQLLKEKQTINASFGETLSWNYLNYVRNHPIKWNIPTEILYEENDDLTSLETISDFAKNNNAGLTVMKNGEHWFHTKEEMEFHILPYCSNTANCNSLLHI